MKLEVRGKNSCISVYISFKSYEFVFYIDCLIFKSSKKRKVSFHFTNQLWSLGNKNKIRISQIFRVDHWPLVSESCKIILKDAHCLCFFNLYI